MNVRYNRCNEPSSSRSLLPSLVVKRLSLYLRYFEELAEKGDMTSSSPPIGRGAGLECCSGTEGPGLSWPVWPTRSGILCARYGQAAS
ncbi:MAG: hypothetical protein J7L99_03135 [Planctomycetes bacterium]|nr:hypothetical protein [Planctomycetota bacterium]